MMDYEKEYKDLIVRLKTMANAQPNITKSAIENYFPEIREDKTESEIIEALEREVKWLETEAKWDNIGGIPFDKVYAWIKEQKDKKSKWDANDEEISGYIIDILNREGHFGYIIWMNSLKNRIYLKKDEWDYFDKMTLEIISQQIDKIPEEDFIDNAKVRCSEWLKYRIQFLSSQDQWKPSKEQLHGLNVAITTLRCQYNIVIKSLDSLYNDLKKL